jgi:two-component system, sensor histidine kinase and response regulator
MMDVKHKCRASGMDYYLSKPVDHTELLDVLAQYIKSYAQNRAAKKYDLQDMDSSVLDLTITEQFLDGDRQQLSDMLIQFRDKYKPSYAELKSFTNNDNLLEAEMLVHTIKGVAGILGATKLGSSALTLETTLQQDRDRDKNKENYNNNYDELLRQFKTEMENLFDYSLLLEKKLSKD